MPLPISVFIIALNEAKRIGRTIEAVRDLADDIVLIDSGSTDETAAIAESLGARVIYHPWSGYGRQKRYGEEQCRHDWLFNVDADEVVTPELRDEIRLLFQRGVPEIGAYSIRIVDVVPGDSKPRRLAYAHKYVRLYHKRAGSYSASSVHDIVHLEPGFRARALRRTIYHFSVLDIGTQIEKYNSYTDALVEDMNERKIIKPVWRIFTEFPSAFFKAYVLRRHFLRGRYGYLTAMNYAFFRHLRLAKHLEHRQGRSHSASRADHERAAKRTLSASRRCTAGTRDSGKS